MVTYDLDSPSGQQEFQNWVNRTIQNEINSYARQVLGISNTGVGNASVTSSSGTGSAGNIVIPSGSIFPYAGGTGATGTTLTDIPEGWLLCFGQAVSRVAYSTLFRVIGTTYGVGDGSTTFNIPDLRGRAPHGKDDMGGTAQNFITSTVSGITGTTLGAVGGSQSLQAHTHGTTGNDNTDHAHSGTTGTDSPDHAHQYDGQYDPNVAQGGPKAGLGYLGGYYGRYTQGASARHTHSFTTGGRSAFHQHSVGGHDQSTTGYSANMPPTIITNYIIKT